MQLENLFYAQTHFLSTICVKTKQVHPHHYSNSQLDPTLPPTDSIDANHRSTAAARAQVDGLHFCTDEKSHKHCQRHSERKKHPLKIHPWHTAPYFRHWPSPHLGLVFLCGRLIIVI